MHRTVKQKFKLRELEPKSPCRHRAAPATNTHHIYTEHSQQRAIGCDVVSEDFSCHSPALYFSDSHLWTVKWPFPPVTSTQRVRPDSFLPLPTFLRCLGLLFPFPQPFRDLVLFLPSVTDSGTTCASPCSSSLSQPLHFFSSDQPMSHNLFYTHPPSTTTFLVTCRCLSVHASLVFLRGTAWIGSSHTPSVSSSQSCVVPHFLQ